MKVLWITNTAFGILGKKIYGNQMGGLWMSALMDEFIMNGKCKLIVATTIATKKIIRLEDKQVVFYGMPDQVPLLYNENKKENVLAWKALLENERPDLIQVWGTEFTHGLCALRIAKEMCIPSVIYIQGYLGAIARFYFAGIPYDELKKVTTIRDFINHDSIDQQQKKYVMNAEKEKEMLRLSGNIICENDWCEVSLKALIPDLISYRCPLSVNRVFSNHTWNIDKAEPHSVICTASGYPLKGLHMVLRAVALLKKEYPDIKLYIPGMKMVSDGSLQWYVRKRGYTKYIEKLIRSLDIEKQIIWMGYVSQEELARQYEKTRVFVLSSSIENHSSSLKEAMMVGTPSIASAVGGVPEYVHHGKNGFLYRFEEYEIMAGYIRKLFEDKDLCCKISVNSQEDMKNLHAGSDIYMRTLNIYKDILKL